MHFQWSLLAVVGISTLSHAGGDLKGGPFLKDRQLAPSYTSAVMTSTVVIVDYQPAISTSTVYTTQHFTVIGCAPEVTNCPARSIPVVTHVIPISTTICPVTLTSTHLSEITTTTSLLASSSNLDVAPTISSLPYSPLTSIRLSASSTSTLERTLSSTITIPGSGTLAPSSYVTVETVSQRSSQAIYSSSRVLLSSPSAEATISLTVPFGSSYISSIFTSAPVTASHNNLSTIERTLSSTITVEDISSPSISETGQAYSSPTALLSTLLTLPCPSCVGNITVVPTVLTSLVQEALPSGAITALTSVAIPLQSSASIPTLTAVWRPCETCSIETTTIPYNPSEAVEATVVPSARSTTAVLIVPCPGCPESSTTISTIVPATPIGTSSYLQITVTTPTQVFTHTPFASVSLGHYSNSSRPTVTGWSISVPTNVNAPPGYGVSIVIPGSTTMVIPPVSVPSVQTRPIAGTLPTGTGLAGTGIFLSPQPSNTTVAAPPNASQPLFYLNSGVRKAAVHLVQTLILIALSFIA